MWSTTTMLTVLLIRQHAFIKCFLIRSYSYCIKHIRCNYQKKTHHSVCPFKRLDLFLNYYLMTDAKFYGLIK